MEKNRLNTVLRYAFLTSKWYLRIMHVLFFIWVVLVWILILQGENIREYCIYGKDPDWLDSFLIPEGKRCQVDWMYFVREPLFVMAIVYAVIMSPGAVFYWPLKKKFSSRDK